MPKQHNVVREFVVPVGLAVLPAVYLRLTGGSVGALGNAALFGFAILASGFLL